MYRLVFLFFIIAFLFNLVVLIGFLTLILFLLFYFSSFTYFCQIGNKLQKSFVFFALSLILNKSRQSMQHFLRVPSIYSFDDGLVYFQFIVFLILNDFVDLAHYKQNEFIEQHLMALFGQSSFEI
jgi:hypothetical protein